MLKVFLKTKTWFSGNKKIKCETTGSIHCLEYKEDDKFICHCLEFDIVAEGQTKEKAREELAELIKEQIQSATEKNIEEKVLFHPAPIRYWTILSNLRNKLARKELLNMPSITSRDILNKFECTPLHG